MKNTVNNKDAFVKAQNTEAVAYEKKPGGWNTAATISAAVVAVTIAAGIALMAAVVSPAKSEIKRTQLPAASVQTPVPEAAAKTAEFAKAKAPEQENLTAETSDTAKTAKTTETEDQAVPVIIYQQAPVQQQAPIIVERQTPAAQVQQEEAPVQQTTPVVTEQAPVVQQAAPVVTEQTPAVQQTAPVVQEQATAAQQTGTPYIPQGEINDWKIHKASDGFPIGTYFGKVNGQATLNVVKLDDANYKITVTVPNADGSDYIYNINAVANGSKMFYTNASKTAVVYDAWGNVSDSWTVDNGHKGTFDASDAGYTWADSEGTTIFVPWIGF